jgi:hypothetical protein
MTPIYRNLFSLHYPYWKLKNDYLYFFNFELNMDTIKIQYKLEIEIKHGGKKIVEIVISMSRIQ